MPFAFLFELTLLALFSWIFLILLVVGTAVDRHGREDFKWWLIGIGFIAAMVYFWPDFTFFGPPAEGQIVLWDALTGAGFWAPTVTFLGIGLLYSVLEFALAIRKSRRGFAAAWKSFLDTTRRMPLLDSEGSEVYTTDQFGRKIADTEVASHGDIIIAAKTRGTSYRHYKEAVDLVAVFTKKRLDSDYFFRENKIIYAAVSEHDPLAVEPKIDRAELADHVSAWTFLWPFYAISLVIGDLLTEMFAIVADIMANMGGRIVRAAFTDVFKV